jgi:hypothetical protein
MQWAGWNATPEHTDKLKTYEYPILIKQKSEEKRRLRRGGMDNKHQTAKDYLTGTQTTLK